MKVIIEFVGMDGEIAINGVMKFGYYHDDEDDKMKIYIDQEDGCLVDAQFLADADKIKSIEVA